MHQELFDATEAEILGGLPKGHRLPVLPAATLRAALTHASGANTRLASNERLEFLGDAVLGLVTCEQLYNRFPDYEEGDLTKIKSVVVSRRICARFSKAMNLGDFLFLGKGMNAHTTMPPSLLADVFESMVAAIYLDGGLEAARKFILEYLSPEIEQVAEEAHAGNYKSMLQQVAHGFSATPQYVVLDEKGPDHSKCFKIGAVIGRGVLRWCLGTKQERSGAEGGHERSGRDQRGAEVPFATD